MNDADIMLRAHRGALQLREILEDVIRPALMSGIEKLDKNLELLEAARMFVGKDMTEDIQEAISEARRLDRGFYGFIVRLEQVATRLGVVDRMVGESARLTRQARDKVSGAVEEMGEAVDMSRQHVNLMASAATLERGLEHIVAGDKDRIKLVIRLAGVKVIRDILEEMGVGDGKGD
jgi:hypothetical protein